MRFSGVNRYFATFDYDHLALMRLPITHLACNILQAGHANPVGCRNC